MLRALGATIASLTLPPPLSVVFPFSFCAICSLVVFWRFFSLFFSFHHLRLVFTVKFIYSRYMSLWARTFCISFSVIRWQAVCLWRRRRRRWWWRRWRLVVQQSQWRVQNGQFHKRNKRVIVFISTKRKENEGTKKNCIKCGIFGGIHIQWGCQREWMHMNAINKENDSGY